VPGLDAEGLDGRAWLVTIKQDPDP